MTKREKLVVIEKLKKGHQKVKDNWVQGVFIERGSVCALGALGMRSFGTINRINEAAACFLYEALPGNYKDPAEVTPDSKASTVADYNDSHDKRDVLALYRKAIKAAEAAL